MPVIIPSVEVDFSRYSGWGYKACGIVQYEKVEPSSGLFSLIQEKSNNDGWTSPGTNGMLFAMASNPHTKAFAGKLGIQTYSHDKILVPSPELLKKIVAEAGTYPFSIEVANEGLQKPSLWTKWIGLGILPISAGKDIFNHDVHDHLIGSQSLNPEDAYAAQGVISFLFQLKSLIGPEDLLAKKIRKRLFFASRNIEEATILATRVASEFTPNSETVASRLKTVYSKLNASSTTFAETNTPDFGSNVLNLAEAIKSSVNKSTEAEALEEKIRGVLQGMIIDRQQHLIKANSNSTDLATKASNHIARITAL